MVCVWYVFGVFGLLLLAALAMFFRWRARVLKEKCQVPSDAMALTGVDAESYRNDFEGKWYAIESKWQPTALPSVLEMLETQRLRLERAAAERPAGAPEAAVYPCDRCLFDRQMHIDCDELDVSDSHMVLRTQRTRDGGGRINRTTSRELVFHRGTGGTLYIDRFGTKATKWDPAHGEIVIEYAIGIQVGLRRAAGYASGGGGGGGGVGGDLAAQLTSLAQLHSNGGLSDIEFEAAKAKLVGGGGAMYTPVVAATAVPVTVEMSRAGLIANPGATTGAAFAEQASV